MIPCYSEVLGMLYTLVSTNIHQIVVLWFDDDVSDQVAMMEPELYADGVDKALFNWGIFSKWVVYGLWHGCLVWGICSNWVGEPFDKSKLSTWYEPSDFQLGMCTSFVSLVIVVNCRFVITCVSPTARITVVSTIGFLLITYILMLLAGHTFFNKIPLFKMGDLQGIPLRIFSDGTPLAAIAVSFCGAFAVDCIERIVQYHCYPNSLDRVRKRRSCPASTAPETTAGPPSDSSDTSQRKVAWAPPSSNVEPSPEEGQLLPEAAKTA
jgi:magnesium-transporting ATPase (P-type)